MAEVLILTTGGTIDKLYFDALSTYQIGDSVVDRLLQTARVTLPYRRVELMRKDSLELTDDDRALIRERVAACSETHVLITHGTDTMTQTAECLQDIAGKVIVLTGAMQPARMRASDAPFNLGLALGALQCLPPGVYIAMNGQVFHAGQVRKNRHAGRFEAR